MSASLPLDPAPEIPAKQGNKLSNIARRVRARRPWMTAGFLITSFIYGTALFVILVTLIAVGLSLAITLVGLPILAIALLTWIAAAMIERRRIRFFFGETLPSPYRPRAHGSLLKRAKVLIGDGAVWRDLAYIFLLFPAGIVEFVVATIALSLPGAALIMPLFYWAGDGPTLFGDSTGSGWQIDTLPDAIALFAIGLVLVPPAVYAMDRVARAHLTVARWFLSRSHTEELAERAEELEVRAEELEVRAGALEVQAEELEEQKEELVERVDVLTKTRSDVMDAMLVERRRIERDLHDGAQQRLVSLAMTLGMAKAKMESDPEAARQLVAASHEEAKLVLGELRQLVRGIHPAVLTDRGLDAAISAIAGRSQVPVTVEVHLEERPPEAIESTAYFIVTEALTNVAKHSEANRARVTIWLENGILTVLVWDDGKGGARLGVDSGLRGLADRVAALDGSFTIESPPGGGTTIRAEIPCQM
jgi:signal transduction histidine kinase